MSDATQSQNQMPVPVAAHEKMKPFEGSFTAAVKIWMKPDEPFESTGVMTSTWQLGGLYLHQDYVGDKVEGPFPSFEGKGYWGYNTTSNCYEGFWVDNASSAMQMESGDVDATGKTWTMIAEMACPQTGKPMKKRSVITLNDNDSHKMESFFCDQDGNEMKAMEIDYTRM